MFKNIQEVNAFFMSLSPEVQELTTKRALSLLELPEYWEKVTSLVESSLSSSGSDEESLEAGMELGFELSAWSIRKIHEGLVPMETLEDALRVIKEEMKRSVPGTKKILATLGKAMNKEPKDDEVYFGGEIPIPLQ